jgi:hypothetical protein
MRKNIASVIDAFHAEETYQDKTCRAVYSYALVIAVRDGETVYVLDPAASPSRTTTSQIRAVLAAFPGAKTLRDEACLLEILAGGPLDDEDGPSPGYREDFHADG